MAGRDVMKRVVADKIASVAQSCGLTPELRLSHQIQNNKYAYNNLAQAVVST